LWLISWISKQYKRSSLLKIGAKKIVEERRGKQLEKVNEISERKYYLKMYLLTDNKETRQMKGKTWQWTYL
jgi:hypothetical protein